MIIEKFKQTGLLVAMGFVGLGTVTTALLAYQGTPANPGAPKGNHAAQIGERSKAHETKTITTAKPAQENQSLREDRERLRAEGEIEASHQEVDALLADAALIQIELDITTKRIEKPIEFLGSLDSRYVAEDYRLTAKEREAAMESLHVKRDLMSNQVHSDRKNYATKWTQLARLRRQIARQSRALGVTSDLATAETDLSRRLDGLEKKIDQIIDSLRAK